MIVPGAENDTLLAFCHNGSVATCFMNAALRAFAEDASRPVRRLTEYFDAAGPYIHDNRSRIARYFLECTDKQWLWFLDNDMDFPSGTLYAMLDAAEQHNVQILGAVYWNQYAHSNCYLSWLLFTPENGIKAMPDVPDTQDPVEVTAVGMGCTLIHRDVLQAIADMHPDDPWDTFAADILLQFEEGGYLIGRTPDDLRDQIKGRTVKSSDRMGEDVTFSIRARRAGFKTYGLPTVTAEHYKPMYMPHGTQARELVGTG